MSPRKLAKGWLMHARSARIRALAAPRGMPWLRRRLGLPANEIFDPLAHEPPGESLVHRLDAPAMFDRPLPRLAEADSGARPFFAQRTLEVSAATYVAEFHGGIAWGHPTGGVFTSDGRFVPAFTHDPCGAAFHSVWTRLRLPKPKHLRGRVLYLVTPQAADNFHHWLIDLLPRLGLVRRAGYALSDFDHVIVNHSQRAYQISTLAHLGISPERIIAADPSVYVRADVLVVPSLKPDNQTISAADLGFLREAFLESTSIAPPKRRIFLSREDAGFRRLRNEAQLRPLLQSLDFEIVSLAGLSVPTQARLFSEAEIIAGPAGAAFANLVFASPGARVIEIAPPQWLAAFHWMVSARAGLEHTVVLGEGSVMRGVPDASARQKDLSVDAAKFMAAVEEGVGGLKA
jgi:capsular polysaccharide biosynthesis protein